MNAPTAKANLTSEIMGMKFGNAANSFQTKKFSHPVMVQSNGNLDGSTNSPIKDQEDSISQGENGEGKLNIVDQVHTALGPSKQVSEQDTHPKNSMHITVEEDPDYTKPQEVQVSPSISQISSGTGGKKRPAYSRRADASNMKPQYEPMEVIETNPTQEDQPYIQKDKYNSNNQMLDEIDQVELLNDTVNRSQLSKSREGSQSLVAHATKEKQTLMYS